MMTYTHRNHIEACRYTMGFFDAHSLAREIVRGHIPSHGLHLAVGLVFLGDDLVIFFHHLGRFVNRKDLCDVRCESL